MFATWLITAQSVLIGGVMVGVKALIGENAVTLLNLEWANLNHMQLNTVSDLSPSSCHFCASFSFYIRCEFERIQLRSTFVQVRYLVFLERWSLYTLILWQRSDYSLSTIRWCSPSNFLLNSNWETGWNEHCSHQITESWLNLQGWITFVLVWPNLLVWIW